MIARENYTSEREYKFDLYNEVADKYFKTAQENADRFITKLPAYIPKDDIEEVFYIILGDNTRVIKNDLESVTESNMKDDYEYETIMENDFLKLTITYGFEDGNFYITEDDVKLERKDG